VKRSSSQFLAEKPLTGMENFLLDFSQTEQTLSSKWKDKKHQGRLVQYLENNPGVEISTAEYEI